jgi:hypothetical protein
VRTVREAQSSLCLALTRSEAAQALGCSSEPVRRNRTKEVVFEPRWLHPDNPLEVAGGGCFGVEPVAQLARARPLNFHYQACAPADLLLARDPCSRQGIDRPSAPSADPRLVGALVGRRHEQSASLRDCGGHSR